MRAEEIRKMDADQLNAKLKELKGELFNLRFQHAINQLDNPHKIADVKNGHYTSNVLLDFNDLLRIVKLIDRVLEAKREKLFLEVLELCVKLIGTHLLQFFCEFCCLHYASSFTTNLHLMGSL